MNSLRNQLTELVGGTFVAVGLDPAFGRVQRSGRPELGQYQCNGAMAAAKAAKKNPREIAGQIIAQLEGNAFLGELSIAGPGFININIADEALSRQANALKEDDRSGVPLVEPTRTVVLDFGGPNIAKPMHVGHLRSGIVGDAMQQIHNFAGDKTISDVHLGDWGLQMGQIISEIESRYPESAFFEEGKAKDFPEESPVTLDELEELYPAASAACKADAGRMEVARQATVDFQQGHKGYRALRDAVLKLSLDSVRREYAALGVSFDLWKGEADVVDIITPMIAGLKDGNYAEESDGALVMRVEQNTDKKPMPPLMLVNSVGATGYHTTDLATIVDRVENHDPDYILYVTDYRQNLHFEQVFRAARKAALLGDEVELAHIGFGTMNGPGNTPLKTRDGDLPKLHDLIVDATEKAEERLKESGIGTDYPEEERRQVARQVALAALKFADLSNQPHSNYIFDLDRFTTFEGKTGPYLLYAAVRIKSILRKAEEAGESLSGAGISVATPEERDLILALDGFAEAFDAAYTKRSPNLLCDFVYSLAQAFSKFYTAHHILSESDALIKASRLQLCALALREIEQVLHLLGIAVPDRM